MGLKSKFNFFPSPVFSTNPGGGRFDQIIPRQRAFSLLLQLTQRAVKKPYEVPACGDAASFHELSEAGAFAHSPQRQLEETERRGRGNGGSGWELNPVGFFHPSPLMGSFKQISLCFHFYFTVTSHSPYRNLNSQRFKKVTSVQQRSCSN